jgi:peptide-methionine (S)-S-oxide reductase
MPEGPEPDRTGGKTMSSSEVETQAATLGGGCFWCLEAAFARLRGVEEVISGYAGGDTADPTYEEVCSGTTGHAEVVQVHFDPEVVPYRALLDVFFTVHDPTTPNRQGADVGTQYRSVILWHDEEQRAIAERTILELEQSNVFDAPIVTEVVPLEAFYPAEDVHQRYFDRNAGAPYCRIVIEPKLAKLRQRYASWLAE